MRQTRDTTIDPALDPDDWREALRRGALGTLEPFVDSHPVWQTKTDVRIWHSGLQAGSPVGLGGTSPFGRSNDPVAIVAAGTHLRFARIDDGYDDPCNHVNTVAIELRASDGPLAGVSVALWVGWDTGPKDAGILEAFEPLTAVG